MIDLPLPATRPKRSAWTLPSLSLGGRKAYGFGRSAGFWLTLRGPAAELSACKAICGALPIHPGFDVDPWVVYNWRRRSEHNGPCIIHYPLLERARRRGRPDSQPGRRSCRISTDVE